MPGVRLGRPTVVGVERRALRFDELVEGVRVEHLIQPLVERVPAGRRQLIRRQSTTPASVRGPCDDPWPCRECSTADRSCRSPFNHGLLARALVVE